MLENKQCIELDSAMMKLSSDISFPTTQNDLVTDDDDFFSGFHMKRAYSTTFQNDLHSLQPSSPSKKSMTNLTYSEDILPDYFMKKGQEKAQKMSYALYEEREKQEFKCNLQTIKNTDYMELNTISTTQLSELIQAGKQMEIIDCRFPYEFNAGAIKNAINIYEPSQLINHLFGQLNNIMRYIQDKFIFVFHCEFGKHRSPKLMQFLRSIDRQIHVDVYPRILFSEMYLLEGGYSKFFSGYRNMCKGEYLPMTDHMDESEKYMKQFNSSIKKYSLMSNILQ